MTTRRRFLINLLVVTGSLVVGLAAAEIGLRLAGIAYPFPWTVDSERGLALRPGAEGVWHEEGVARFRINSDGLRDGEHAVPKPPNVLRIAVLGDSFAEALQVAAGHAFWAVLERELGRCPALRGRPIETLNFGVSGYATAQALITLRRKVWRYQPDIVLLAFFAGNDVEDNAPGLSGYDRRPYYRLDGDNLVLDVSFSRNLGFRLLGAIWTALIDPTIDRSRLIQLLNEARRKLRVSGPQVVSAAVADAQDSARMSTPADAGKEAGLSDSVFRPPEGHAWQQAWAITEALMLMMRDEVQVGGAKFWLATLSAGWQVNPDPALRTATMQRLGIDTAFYPERRLEGFAQEHGIDILTLAEPLQRYAEREGIYLHGFANTAFGDGHWNENGHRRAGELMAARLCRSFANR